MVILVITDFIGFHVLVQYNPIGSMYGIYANIGGILMVNGKPYMAYMDPMGMYYAPSKLEDSPHVRPKGHDNRPDVSQDVLSRGGRFSL